jgi:excisionase family DNA binding protein
LKGGIEMYNTIPEVMTFNECKDLLRVGKNTLLDLLHSNTIQGFKIGSRWKIPKESVVEFIRYGG